jgi:hypothetical protein
LTWITGLHNRPTLSRSLTSLLSITDRFEALLCSFALHIQLADPSNPVIYLRNYLQSHPPWPPQVLLPRIFYNTTWNIFRSTNDISENPRMKLSFFLQESRLRILQRSSRLCSYLLPEARIHQYGRDSCFHINDPYIRSLAISWRGNTFGVYKYCTCGQPFRRTHITQCSLVDALISPLLNDCFAKDLQEFPSLEGSSYCIIDSLLNHKFYNDFEKFILHIDNLLHS